MYSKEFRSMALRVLDECGSSVAAADKLGGPCAGTLRQWRLERLDPKKRGCVHLDASQRAQIASLRRRGESVASLAARFGVSDTTVYNVLRGKGPKGDIGLMERKEAMPRGRRGEEPEGELEALRRRCAELELDNAILAQTIEVLKKDPGVDPSEMTNREKAAVIDALRGGFEVGALCRRLSIARASYYYCRKAAGRPDPHAATRERIRSIFEGSAMTFGSERVWNALRSGDDGLAPLRVSEKVVRRLMREEGLRVIYNKRRRGYSSYKGEISEHPGDRVRRDFRAGGPGELWLTDITQFSLGGSRFYLSAIVDCFDGKVASHRLSERPDAKLANSTLLDAVEGLGGGRRPVLHSDCGCHYRWPGWISICEENGIERSMSRKGCSPDNSAMEGFFGRLKNEFFYHRDWDGVGFEEFGRRLDDYIVYYNERRKKKSLGWKSPKEYRLSLGYAA